MAKFFENILKDEEQTGGYNIGEPDDDIFKLGDSQFPGELEEYAITIDEQPVITEPETVIEEIELPVIADEKGTESESFEENSSASDSIWRTFPTTSSPDNYDNFLKTESADISFQTFDEPKKSIEQAEVKLDEGQGIKLDDAFKAELAQMLEKKKKTETTVEIRQENNDNLFPKTDDFQPVEEISDTQYFDFSKIDLSRPSEKTSEELNEKVIEKVEVIENEVVDQKSEKKKKKPVIWYYFGGTVAAMIILTGVIYLVISLLLPTFQNNSHQNKDSLTVKKDTIKHVEKVEKKELVKIDTIKTEEKIDTAHKEVSLATEKKIDTIIPKKVKKIAEKKEIAKVEKKVEPNLPKENLKRKVKDSIKEIDYTKKQHADDSYERTQEKIKMLQKKKAEDLAKQKEKAEDLAKAKEKAEVKPKETKEIKKELKKENEIKDEKAVFTVQIYSSPSKEDAHDWLEKLKQKNIDGFISEQMIRDVKWYRVRFGEFPTREEARSAAMRLGYSQTWIDRIK